jgi:hypothetical protein
MGFRLPRAPGCHFRPPQKGIARLLAARVEHCNEEVIDYFGRCVEPAAQADAILWNVEDQRLHGGRSRPIDYRLGIL